MKNKYKPEEITPAKADKILSSSPIGKEDYKPLGLFFLKENEGWAAIDNSTGSAWTELFGTKKSALSWLNDGKNDCRDYPDCKS